MTDRRCGESYDITAATTRPGRTGVTASGALTGALREALPADRLLLSPEDLIVHGYDGTWLDRLPDAVVSPVSADEIALVLQLARRLGVAVIPRGAGSGLAGGSVPTSGGIVLSTSRMNRIRSIDSRSLLAVVEAGVVNADLQAAADRLGLLYPPDPASLNQATIGGNVATSASGPRCLKYGGTKDYVVALQVVTPDGVISRIGQRSHQPSDDHHLVQLFVGSEGTLGVVSEVTVRLVPRPPARGTVMATFARLEEASVAVGAILQAGVVPLALEMMDRVTLRCVESFLRAGLPTDAEAMLLVDVDGEESAVPAQLRLVAQIFQTGQATTIREAATPSESQALWRARRSTSSSFGRLRPNKLGEDVSVPRSAIPAMVRAVQAIAESKQLLIPLFGHIGDGNLHPNILCDLRDLDEMTRVGQAAREIFLAALALGGTLSGEHGIGQLKREFLPDGLDAASLVLMRRIKDEVDPTHLLNPGKLTAR